MRAPMTTNKLDHQQLEWGGPQRPTKYVIISVSLYYIILYHIILYYIILHYIILYYITLL